MGDNHSHKLSRTFKGGRGAARRKGGKVFINEKILKKLMMRAYKANGIYMAREDGWYYLADAFAVSWQAKIAVGCMPKLILGAMVECAGAIPEEGEGWTADEEKNQLEAFLKWEDPESERVSEVSMTPVLLSTPGGTIYNVVQLPNNAVMCIKPEYITAICAQSVDRGNGEEMIKGPWYDGHRGIYASTNHAVWRAAAATPPKLEYVIGVLGEQALRYDEGQD